MSQYATALVVERRRLIERGRGAGALDDEFRARGFPESLAQQPTGDVAPMTAAYVLSQLVAVASIGGVAGRQALRGADVLARSLGYGGPELTGAVGGFTPAVAAQTYLLLTTNLAQKLSPEVVAGGCCRGVPGPRWNAPGQLSSGMNPTVLARQANALQTGLRPSAN